MAGQPVYLLDACPRIELRTLAGYNCLMLILLWQTKLGVSEVYDIL
jgi:hypothetical protein